MTRFVPLATETHTSFICSKRQEKDHFEFKAVFFWEEQPFYRWLQKHNEKTGLVGYLHGNQRKLVVVETVVPLENDVWFIYLYDLWILILYRKGLKTHRLRRFSGHRKRKTRRFLDPYQTPWKCWTSIWVFLVPRGRAALEKRALK